MLSAKEFIHFAGKISSRNISTSLVICTNHYEVLGVGRSATLAEIKAAYYKKSKEYHPDLNESEESVSRFRAITEAYEVLGNVHSKKLYDKGAIVRDMNVADTPEMKFHKSRSKIVPTEGTSTVYNFDAWVQAHYSKNFDREKIIRRKKAERVINERNQVAGYKVSYLITFCLLFASSYLFSVLIEEDIDKTKKYEIVSNKKK